MPAIPRKNGEEIASRSYRAHEPFVPNISVRNALNCLQAESIPANVVSAFTSQNRNRQGNEYRADVNGDVWILLYVEIPHCQVADCGRDVDREGDLCDLHRNP